jgi:lysophospholipase L1-like esterase
VLSGEHLCVSKEDLPSFTPYSLDTTVLIPERVEFGNNKLFGTKIANFGDSIFGNKRPPNDISTFIAEQTGATVYNLGFGGCRMSASHNADWDAFSMASIATAIASNDFTEQDAVNISTAGMPTYFSETLALLKSIDFDAVDIITIAYGTNDFGQSADFDNPNNLYDKTTFCGALRYSLETLMTAFPHLKVFVCTPTYRFWMTEQGEFTTDSDAEVRNGKKLTDFVQAVIEVAESYHVRSIDNYFALGINKFNRDYWFPATDGTHHKVVGAKLIAQHMVNAMW